MVSELLVSLEPDGFTSAGSSLRALAPVVEKRRPAELRNIVLLAPPEADVSPEMTRIVSDADMHARLLFDMQQLRGRIALEEGAIRSQELTGDLRHIQLIDYESWHALALNQAEGVCGCARFRLYTAAVTFSNLGAAHCALARSNVYGELVSGAIEGEITEAKRRGIGFAEVGGWAVDHDSQRTMTPITLALVIFALARRLGHCIGITTASRKSNSASILRRMGGEPLQIGGVELPPYFDPQYGCEMELLRFDSISLAAKYQSKLFNIEAHLPTVRVAIARPGNSAYPLRGMSQAA